MEGERFAVPLPGGGWAGGIVTRADAHGILFGSFFGPRSVAPPTPESVAGGDRADAVLVGKFSGLGLRGGSWPRLGVQPGWNREQWPMGPFVREDALTAHRRWVWYAEDDLARAVRIAEPTSDAPGPADGLMGSGYVQKRLDRLLGGGRLEA